MASISSHARSCVQQLEEMFITPDSLKKASLGKFKAFCSKVRKNGAWEPSEGVSIKLRKRSLTVLHADMKQLACLIKGRFAERFQSNSLLFHFHILIPLYYVNMKAEVIETFGIDSSKALLSHGKFYNTLDNFRSSFGRP
jgi:hypothetical protein